MLLERRRASGRPRASLVEPLRERVLALHARGRRLRAALAAVLVRNNAPELWLMREWLDNWSGLGLIIAGMSHQGFTVSLGEHGAGRWIAVFDHGRGGYEPVDAAGTGQEPTPWRAVQRAAWEVLDKR
jgi:hypothetical protein